MRARPAFVAVACAVIALTGCGPRAAGPLTERAEQPATVAKPQASIGVDKSSLTAAGRAALRYALAARSWTARSYATQHRRQLALSAGPLRRALKRAAPTRRQLAAYRADDAIAAASPIAVTALLDSATQARYRVLLDERSSAAGQSARQRAAYLVELRRDAGRWLVTAFTIQP